MRIEDTYNIHCFLYDVLHIGTHHFKSKLLCKLGFHNYQIRGKCETRKEVIKENNTTITKYHKIWTSYYKCYCCGKKIDLEKEVS